MITANDARGMLEAPAITIEAVEERIREAAKTRHWTCFHGSQLPSEIMATLVKGGFNIREVVRENKFLVEWPEPDEAKLQQSMRETDHLDAPALKGKGEHDPKVLRLLQCRD